MRRKTLVLTGVLLLGLATVGLAETRKTKCNANGRVYTFVADFGTTMDFTMMWTKATADNDILVFFSDTLDPVGLGIGLDDRFERVTIGALPGVPYDVAVVKASGPNSNCYLNVTNAVPFLASGAPNAALRYRGSIDELAATDDRYARLRQAVRRYLDLKAPRE